MVDEALGGVGGRGRSGEAKWVVTDEISPERGKAHLDAIEINCDDDVAPSVSMAVAAATNADSERSRP